MLLCTNEIVEDASSFDNKIERYFGQFFRYESIVQSMLEMNKFGRGVLLTRYKELYEGWFEDDEPNGQGRLIQNHGYYIGEFKNSKFEGFGKFIYNDGRKYEGDFKDHKYHGWG